MFTYFIETIINFFSAVFFLLNYLFRQFVQNWTFFDLSLFLFFNLCVHVLDTGILLFYEVFLVFQKLIKVSRLGLFLRIGHESAIFEFFGVSFLLLFDQPFLLIDFMAFRPPDKFLRVEILISFYFQDVVMGQARWDSLLEVDFLQQVLIGITEIFRRLLLCLIDLLAELFDLNRVNRIYRSSFLAVFASNSLIFNDSRDSLVLWATIEHVFGAMGCIWRHHSLVLSMVLDGTPSEDVRWNIHRIRLNTWIPHQWWRFLFLR